MTSSQQQCLPDMLFIIFMQKFKEPEAEVKCHFDSLTRSSAVANRPRDAPCR